MSVKSVKIEYFCSFSGLKFKGTMTAQNHMIFSCDTRNCPFRSDYQPLAIVGRGLINSSGDHLQYFMIPLNHNFSQPGVGLIRDGESQ